MPTNPPPKKPPPTQNQINAAIRQMRADLDQTSYGGWISDEMLTEHMTRAFLAGWNAT